MRTIFEAQDLIRSNKNREVCIKVLGIRNKNEHLEGIISEIYPNIFIVDTKEGKRSFSYSDVLIGNIIVQVN